MPLLRVVIQNTKDIEVKIDQYLSSTTHLIYLSGVTSDCSIVSNGGGQCATDWINASIDGIAQSWSWYSEPM